MASQNPYEVGLDQCLANYAPLSPLSFIRRTAAVYPERTAVVHGDLRRTWRETYQRCVRLASALKRRGMGIGDTVAVIGCGGVGDAAVAGAALVGAKQIIAVDTDNTKLDWARKFGATHTVNSAELAPEKDLVKTVQDLTGGFGVDVVIDAVGRPETWKQAFYARDLAGTVVLVGVPTPDMRLDMPLVDFFSRGGSLKSSWYGDCLPERDFPTLIDLYLQGRLPLEKFVSERIGLEDIEEAFHKMHDGKVLRSVVVL